MTPAEPPLTATDRSLPDDRDDIAALAKGGLEQCLQTQVRKMEINLEAKMKEVHAQAFEMYSSLVHADPTQTGM